MIVIDLVVVFVLKVEIEGEMGDLLLGLQVCLMLQVLCKLIGMIKCMNCFVIFINQIWMKIGVMFGNLEIMMGGNVLKFYLLVCFDICWIGLIKKNDEVIGNEICVKVVKNKVLLLFCEVIFDILYGEGILCQGEIIDFGVQVKIVDKVGVWYSYNGEKIGQGKDNVCEFLCENLEIVCEIENCICELFGVVVMFDGVGNEVEVMDEEE